MKQFTTKKSVVRIHGSESDQLKSAAEKFMKGVLKCRNLKEEQRTAS